MSTAVPATFLELVQRTWQECGLTNNPPSSVTAQVNMAAKVVNWVVTALQDIEEQFNWRFDWTTVSKVLASGVDTYDPVATWEIDVKEWNTAPCSTYVYITATGLSSRTWVEYVDWEIFRGMNVPPVIGSTLPILWSVNPAGSVVYFPTPSDALHTVVHEFWQGPETLLVNADEPRLPLKYRMAIVWRAVMLYAGHDTASDTYAHAKQELAAITNRMEHTELPRVLTAGSLA